LADENLNFFGKGKVLKFSNEVWNIFRK